MPLLTADIPLDPYIVAETEAALAAAAAVQAGAKTKSGHAKWTVLNEEVMMACLLVRMAEAGDGANFTKVTWKAVADAVNKQTTKGAPKTADSCKNKYQKLKKLYLVVRAIIANSGWTWDDKLGACIGEKEAGTWDEWVKVNPLGAPFRNAGWVHLESFRTLLPDAIARGTHVFRANTAVAEPSSHIVLDEDSQPYGDWPPSDNEPPVQQDKDDSSDESEKENEPEAPSAAKTPAPRKRVAAESATGTAKKPRLSGGRSGAALQSLAETADEFNDLFRNAFAPPGGTQVPPTPVRLKTAIARAKALETWMPEKKHMIQFLKVLQGSKSAVDVYDTFDDEDKDDQELRIMWVKDIIEFKDDE